MIYTFYTSSYSQSVYMYGNKAMHTGVTNPITGAAITVIPTEYIPYVEAHGAKTWSLPVILDALTKGYINQEEYDATIALVPLPTPLAPSVTADDINNVIVSVDETMEWAIGESLTYTAYNALSAPDLSGDKTIKVRLIKVPLVTNASLDTVLTFTINPVKPEVPIVGMDDIEDVVLGMAVGMEYSYDGVVYTQYEEGVHIGLYGNITISIRISAEGINPPSDPVILPFTYNPVTPLAPALSLNGTANTISGMTDLMEFCVDDSTYVLYNSTIFNMINFNNTYLFKGRVKARGANPYSESTVLNLTANPAPVEPVTPLAPSVTNDDTLNTVTGMELGMEWNYDSNGYIAYMPEEFDAVDFTGDHEVLVRIAAEGVNPFGPDTVLTFTTNI